MSATIDRLLVIVEQVEAATGRKWTEQQTAIWLSVLSDLPIDAVNAGYKKWAATYEGGWPMPATIRRLAIEAMEGVTLTADAAWSTVRMALKRWSIYLSPAENAAIVASVPEPARSVANRIGWKAMSGATDLEPFMRAFLIHYGQAAERYQSMRAIPEHLRPRVNDGRRPVPMTKLKSPEDFRHNDNSERERQSNLLRETRNDAG